MNQFIPRKNQTTKTTCAIYAMGKAGRALFLSLQKNNFPVVACFVRYPKKLRNFSKNLSTSSTLVYSELSLFVEYLKKKQTQILFLAVPDDSIEEVAKSLSHQAFLPPLVLHLSGAFSYDALWPLAKRSSPAQFHPLASLSGQNPIPVGTLNAICAAHPEVEKILFQLSQQIKLVPSLVKNGMQPLYHVAASITGNLPIALLFESIQLMQQAGIDEDLARKGLAKLLRSTAQSIERKSLTKALTGPVARGDIGTVKQHLCTLRNFKKRNQIETIYRLLSNQLIHFNNDSEKRVQFYKLLNS
jgi:predicted short-subunit dehydrogenase-like oxidoreductase (DUF2520 family)